ncbi:DUF262 domain-containing HNH endonuclease family protein [Cronobacter sakazakii]|nr:DUF262 domain-containing HNH endonuclease family protein [Cronobacter sakazakii]MDI7653771.1 DUF262 domain-containing HNH endonuclease family protein [Cronobacter sakazakii]MDK1043443.1 DUF262 domain-containing HNH endonuclease family protein [Cronobacter sakazakii]MDK1048761.1 DUF262 domain-containing HNH endonuclease family protein [Cronobacter sakazakii]MDK1056399.1 DUF262 domain-containing HNH endonuclease family protein [Cronobacter sakazakii]
MSKKISGAEYPLSKIFSSDFDYVIPSYQRPYAWTVDQASELFDDLYDFYVREKEDTYFLGSIVLIKEEGKPYSEVIDGQQRLTTLTILLSSITSNLSGDLRSDFENYIREPGRASQGLKPKPRLALRERDREFFAKHIQALDFDTLLGLDPAGLENESQKNIQSNSRLLLDRLKNTFGSDANKLCDFGAFLVQRCFLVAVSTPSQQSAFRVFSVLNNRGLDLLPSDIVKADVIGRIAPARQDDFTEKWEELEVQTGRNGFNDLFGHIRMIYAREKAKRALLEEFKAHVLSVVATPEDLIEKVLEPYAESYLIAKSQQYVSTKNAEDVNRLLKWLNRIDNSDWLPPAILFLSQKKDHPEYVLWFFTKLERLAAYLHICAKNVNQRIERYADVIASLQSSHSKDTPAVSVELTKAEIDEMKDALDGKIYELTARRRNYLILRLDSFLSDGAATYDPTLLTIEHVLPQTVSDGSEWEKLWPDPDERKSWVHRIANLVPLTQKRNSKAQNFDFDTKKTAYFGGKRGVSSYVLTTQVLKTAEWTPSVVDQRQKDLLEILIDRWELRDAN